MTSADSVEVHLIHVPYDSGAKDARMGRGPAHLVDRGLDERIRRLGLSTKHFRIEVEDPFPTEIATTFAVNRLLAEGVQAVLSSDFPLVLSGNCNSCIGIVAGLSESNAAPPRYSMGTQ